MKVHELRNALGELGPGYDHCAVEVWLPGTYIALEGADGRNVIIPRGDRVLIEGQVVPGSGRGFAGMEAD